MTSRCTYIAEFVFSKLPQGLAASLLLAAILLNFVNVFSRYVLRSAIYWADEAMIFLIIWSVLVGAIAISFQGRHLEMDLFLAMLPKWLKKPLGLVVNLATMGIFFFMSWQAAVVINTFLANDQRTIALNMPMAIPHFALLFGFGFSAIAIAARVALHRYVPHEKTPEEMLKDAI